MRPTIPLLLPLLALLGLGCPGGEDDDASDDDTADDDADDDSGDDDSGWSGTPDDDTGGEDADGDGVSVAGGDCNDADPALVHPGDGATLRVPDDHATIQDALDATVDCDQVIVAAGTYHEHLSFPYRGIALVGEAGPAGTTLDADGVGRAITFGGGPAAARLEGFTITGGATDVGGGVYVFGNGHPTLADLVITGNQAERGGGVAVDLASPRFERVWIVDNTAVVDPDDHHGGRGGGLWLSECKPTLDHVVVAGNVAAHPPELDGPPGGGGGLVLDKAAATLSHVVVAGNQGYNGGGLWVVDADPRLAHVVVTANVGINCGGGMNALASDPVIHHSDFWGNDPNDCVGIPDFVGVDGNIAVDPAFLDTAAPLARDWDLHLDPASPLVDAGDPAEVDPDGSPADIGLFGGPGAGGFDLDRDGAPLWWHPGPYDPAVDPGEGWDCDDRDPAVYPGSGC